MTEERKILGMTKVQLGVLGALGACLLMIICLGGFLLRRMGSSAQSPNSVLPATAAPTVTSINAPQVTSTSTTTPTPIPYEQLIPADWKQFKTSLIEIWMPANFRLADKRTKDISVKFGTSELLLTEIPTKSSAFTALVSVSYDVFDGESLDTYLDGKFPSLPYQARIAERSTVFINTREARRIVLEFKLNNIDYDNLIYVIRDGSTLWYIEYVAEITKYFENLDVFKQSINTFRPATYQ